MPKKKRMTSVGPEDYEKMLSGGMQGYTPVKTRGIKDGAFKDRKAFAIVEVAGQHPRLLPGLLKGTTKRNANRAEEEKRVNLKKHLTFVYLPHPDHARAFDEMDVQRQTVKGGAAHLSVYLDKKTRSAIVTQLQSNASPASGEAYDEHAEIRRTHAPATRRLIEAARERLARDNYSLHFLDPRWYKLANKPEVRANAGTPNEAWFIETGIQDSYDRAIAGCNAEPKGTTADIEHAFEFQANLDYPLFEVPRRAFRRR